MNKISLKDKVFLISLVVMVVSITVALVLSIYSIIHLTEEKIEDYKQNTLNEKKKEIKNYTQIAINTVISHHIMSKNHTLHMTKENLQKNVLKVIKSLRYGNDGYFWINNTKPKMVMHPTEPKLDGKDLSNYKDPNGKELFNEFVKVAKNSGNGYVEYMWPKPNFDKPQPKLSYIYYFKEWDWIIGTGIYIDDIQAQADKIRKDSEDEISELILQYCLTIFVFLIVLYMFVRVSVSIYIEKPLNFIVNSLKNSSDTVQNSSNTLVESSNTLNNISTKQDSILQSVVEILESIKKNIDSSSTIAKDSNTISNENLQAMQNGYEYIKELIESMNHIENSSMQIANIIKTIDEIAFQTNLLALNAAVEAARAGEHGLGFAVVAEEVRALANRSAGAAKETANIINTTVDDIKNTSNIANKTNKSFIEIKNKIEINSDLITKVNELLIEQKSSIHTINDSVQELDNVTDEVLSHSTETNQTAISLDKQSDELNESLSLLIKNKNK
jgi:methyl-accepting chemotaxis protein